MLLIVLCFCAPITCAPGLFAQTSTPSLIEPTATQRFPLGLVPPEPIKLRLQAGDAALVEDLHDLLRNAERTLALEPLSVRNDPTSPPGTDPHDYVSYAPYWWPNPEAKDGLPYIRRDGHVNHALRDKGDDKALERMAHATHTLALAYFLSDDARFAIKAEEIMRTWFLDTATYMKPNAEHGQIVPGMNDLGRRAGINEMRFLVDVVDAIGLLSGHHDWPIEERNGLKDWFRDYFYWLRESDHGKQEQARPNNHGTWYDVQFASIALFLDEDDLAKERIERFTKQRIADQIDSSGVQPLEVTRGFSLHYCLFNLEAYFTLANLGERVGIDLWNYVAMNGSSIRKALDRLVPYVGREADWPYPDLGDHDAKDWSLLLSQAAFRYRAAQYRTKLEAELHRRSDTCRYCHALLLPVVP